MLWIGQLDVMTDDTDMFITQRKVPVWMCQELNNSWTSTPSDDWASESYEAVLLNCGDGEPSLPTSPFTAVQTSL